MTAATLSRLPLMAGGTLVGSLGRGVFWILNRLIDLGFWAVEQFMRAPLAISTVAAIAGFSILAGSNALYFQTGRHPAPLFYTPARQATPTPTVRPVVPAPRPHLVPAGIDNETTGSLGSAAAADPIDSSDVLALQQKLVALKLLAGTPDGLFGRRTAMAIRAFEARAGMRPDGRLTAAVIAAVRAAPLPAAEPLPMAQPLPAATTIVASVAPAAATTALAPATTPRVAAAPGKPVPLAPAEPQAVAAVAEASVAAPPAAEAAAPVADTFAANSLPVADPAPAPQVAAIADAAPVAAPASREDLGVGTSTQSASLEPGAMSPAQRLAAQMGTLPPEATADSAQPTLASSADDTDGSTDPVLITKIQRALASLGFLGAKIDGVPGEGTAKAIRNFEVFYDYHVTGLATHQLLNLLVQHGAVI